MSAQSIFRTMFSPDAGQTTTERSFAPRRGWSSSSHQFHFGTAGDVMLNPGPQTSLAQAQVQKSLVDQLGVPVQVNQPPPQIAQPKPAQPQPPQPAGAPAAGVSTTTMLVLGGVAFVAVMMLLRGRKS